MVAGSQNGDGGSNLEAIEGFLSSPVKCPQGSEQRVALVANRHNSPGLYTS